MSIVPRPPSENFADSLEKPLAEWWKSLYIEHRTSCLWFGENVFYVFQPNHNERFLFDAIPITENGIRLQFE